VIELVRQTYTIWHGFYNLFPRLSKYSLGGKIDILFLDLIESLLSAAYATPAHKEPFIKRASTKLDAIKFFVQIAFDLHCLTPEQFARILPNLAEIGRQVGGWLRPPEKQQPPQNEQGLRT